MFLEANLRFLLWFLFAGELLFNPKNQRLDPPIKGLKPVFRRSVLVFKKRPRTFEGKVGFLGLEIETHGNWRKNRLSQEFCV